MINIHPTAIVNPKAEIADDVVIGPFSIVGPNVCIGKGTRFISHCNVSGYTRIGENNTMFPFVSVGTEPQDNGYKGNESYLNIGNNNIFREGFTANVGTKEYSTTTIGNGCYFMMSTHVGHNCKIGNNVIVANGSVFGGYSEIADYCVISGVCAVHQFVRIGRFVMMSGGSVTAVNIPPFVITVGRNDSGSIRGLNTIGLKRNGFDNKTIKALRDLYKIFFLSGLNVSNAIAKIESSIEPIPEVKEFLDFVKTSNRPIATGKRL
ncbi:MAG TPA: acyl-[acyl-carrier-protein]--UDP-N-acetylglucosamine O-acyltransferase [Lentisphaeria bacterium]|nr:MAG: acyl-[acyl-carrier-protein]--UDP-N-acetylglucosamine O-acyltransferase [Lentisphaerae bacterium GWF2_38_69]HBM16181.1 acyl-[acyl-carrier-protein]--UDP-N-acetylglucosamine O-acyltransferase [Lentisphaeria bacterium]